MTHGREDWAGTAQISGLWGVSDLGELAARLGAYSRFDRRGNLVWYNSFENGLCGWSQDAEVLGATYDLFSFGSLTGPLALRMTASPDGETSAQLHVNLPIPPRSRMGWEVWWANVIDNEGYYNIGIQMYIDGREKWAVVVFDPLTKIMSLLDDTLGLVTIAILSDAEFHDDAWHLTKLVFDANTGKYVRVQFDDVEYDVSAYSMIDVAASTKRKIMPIIRCLYSTTVTPGMNVDGAILTYNEP